MGKRYVLVVVVVVTWIASPPYLDIMHVESVHD